MTFLFACATILQGKEHEQKLENDRNLGISREIWFMKIILKHSSSWHSLVSRYQRETHSRIVSGISIAISWRGQTIWNSHESWGQIGVSTSWAGIR